MRMKRRQAGVMPLPLMLEYAAPEEDSNKDKSWL
jgi:hypothetical protein